MYAGVPSATPAVVTPPDPVAGPHALTGGVGERLDDFGEDAHRVGDRQLALLGKSLTQRDALHIRHHIVEEAPGFARIVERKDVRVLEPRCNLDLARKPLGAERGGEVWPE